MLKWIGKYCKGVLRLSRFPYILSALEGILTFISPCILPLLPIYFVYLTGSAQDESPKQSRLVLNSLAFVAGFTIIFVLLGATATALGSFLKEHIDIFRKISGIIMVILGLNFIGLLQLRFLNVDKHLEYNLDNLNFIRSLVFGMVFAFGWTPCVGAFLGSALLLAGSTGSIMQGILLLLFYSLGLGIPFILTAVLVHKAMVIWRGLQKYSRAISIGSGLVLTAAGLLLFAGKLTYLGF
jgi:Cytochrome c biogenesis protein